LSAEVWLKSSMQGDRLELAAAGHWTADNAAEIEKLILQLTPKRAGKGVVDVNMRRVEQFDTYGAWLLERLVRALTEVGCDTQVQGLADRYRVLFDNVHDVQRPPRRRPAGDVFTDTLYKFGRATADIGFMMLMLAQMLGAVAVAGLRVIVRPLTFRLTSLVNQIDRVGWRAVPIILLITFLIGAILAQQGIFHFRRFGADIFVVDMVGVLVLRELGVLIVCIMVAGRSGSAYTAEIGSMKMREEIDALQTMGFNPINVLILPRILALVISVPMLAFLGSISAIYGGGLVAWLYGGIPPEIFLGRLREAISFDHFMVGMIKAPFMALIIGIIACVDGLQVEGSAESLGARTTASVVKSIFFVIVLDGFFAIFFAAIGR
jgi:phospholipid/cholesterol/gamma-HCH transport system permease protein